MPADRNAVLNLSAFRYNPKDTVKRVEDANTTAGSPVSVKRDLAICDMHYPTTPSARSAFRTKAGKRVTPHQWAVYDLVRTIPVGQVSTYKEVCSALGAGSPRSVGGALRNNPFAPFVPCHRIVASNLFIGGFFGEWTDLKQTEPTEAPAAAVVKENWHDEFKGKGTGVVQWEKVKMLAMEGVMFDKKGKLVGGEEFIWKAKPSQ